MAQKGIILTGFKELDQELARIEPKMQKKVLRDTLRATGKQLAERLRSVAPVQSDAEVFKSGKRKGETKGETKASIRVRTFRATKGQKKQGLGGFTGISVSAGGDTKEGKAWHAQFIELGAPKRNIEPRLWMKSAFEESKPRTRQRFISNLKNFVRSYRPGRI